MTDHNTDRERQFDRIVQRYYEAQECGEPFESQELFEQYPEFVSELKSFLEDVHHLDATEVAHTHRTDANYQSAFRADTVVQYVGEYRILGEIARGGMGVVYKAQQQRLRRTVALKMILSGRFARPTDVARFRREARAAAGLQHGNIVSVHEVGEHEGHHYYTMDFIAGVSLTDKLREGSLQPQQAAKLVEVLARTVHYAHQEGVLHRDLKPSNVLIDGEGKPFVADFGLAKPLNEAANSNSQDELTLTGQIIGTPGFMPPEQAAAKHQLISVASDTYSLGAILYACLGGRAPFLAESFAETVRQVIEREPLPIRTLNPRIPLDLATICHKCLEKMPHRRYHSAEQLAEDLERFLEGKPIRARPISRAERLRRWCWRQPTAAALILALVTLTIAGTWFGIRNQQFLLIERQIRQQTEHLLYSSDLQLAQRAWNVNDVEQTRRIVQQYKDRSDLTSFEWHYWKRQLETARLNLRSQSGNAGFESVSYSVDGSRVAATGRHPTQGLLAVWDAESGQELITITEPQNRFNCVTWHPDGTRIATSRPDTVIQVWDSDSGTELLTIGTPTNLYQSLPFLDPRNKRPDDPAKSRNVVFSSDGRFLAAPGEDNSVRIWSSSTGEPVHRFDGHDAMVVKLAFSRDGRWLASSSLDGSVKIWDVNNQENWATIPSADSGRQNISFDFHPDGNLLAIGVESQSSITLYDVVERKRRDILDPKFVNAAPEKQGLSQGVNWLEFDRDGSRLAVANADRTITLWDVERKLEQFSLKGHAAKIRGVTFRPDGRELASIASDTVKIWSSRTSHAPLLLQRPQPTKMWQMHACAVSPNQRYAAGCASAETANVQKEQDRQPQDIDIWDLTTGKLVHSLAGHTDRVQWIQFLADDTRLISGSRDWANVHTDERRWEVIAWDLATGMEIGRFKLLEDQFKFQSIAASPDGSQIAHARDQTVDLVDPLTGDVIQTLPNHPTPIVAVVWMGNDKLALLQMSRQITVWDLSQSPKRVCTFPVPNYGRRIVASPDQMLIALTANQDELSTSRGEVAIDREEVAILDAKTGTLLAWLKGHALGVNSLAFSRDSRRLATTSSDGTVRIWDAKTGAEVLSFPGKFDSLAFSRDSRTLIAGGSEGLVVWKTR